MKTLALWLSIFLAPACLAAPPATAPDVVVINCTLSSTHLTVNAWSASAELDPVIFATGECAVVFANLMEIGYTLQTSAGNDSGGANTVFTLTTEGK